MIFNLYVPLKNFLTNTSTTILFSNRIKIAIFIGLPSSTASNQQNQYHTHQQQMNAVYPRNPNAYMTFKCSSNAANVESMDATMYGRISTITASSFA
jgi:hypothetical protein